MKNIKKLLSIVMVLAMVLSLGVSAFAEGPEEGATANVTIEKLEKDTANHKYGVYQIFTGTQVSKPDNSQIGDLKWGTGINASEFLTALMGDTEIGSKFANVLHVDGKAEGSDVYVKDSMEAAQNVAKVLENNKDNHDLLDKFAEIAAAHLSTVSATIYSIPDKDAGQSDTANVVVGYYLIVDETDGDDLASSARNKTMLQVTQSVTVKLKYDIPSSEKKVMDENDSTKPVTVNPGPTNDQWQDSADHDIGDTVYFKLTGTLPTDLAEYDTYKLIFHDEEEAGLKFLGKENVRVFVGENEIKTGFEVVTDGLEDECTFEVRFADVKTIPGVAAGSKINVVYAAQLDEDAVVGMAGNPNEMYMEYSNHSTNEGTGKTPKDKVIVFTYELDTKKVDGAGEPLDGAGFTLLKKYAQPEGNLLLPSDSPEYTYENVQKAVKDGWLIEKDAEGNAIAYWKVVGKLDAVEDRTVFSFPGIDDGTYRLVETEVPAGYNKADDMEFTVTGTHTNDGEENPLTITDLKANGKTLDPNKPIDIEMTCDANEGTASTNVVNQNGLELPETGGIGTTIFYVVGAILVAGAVILLVTKKRVNGASK